MAGNEGQQRTRAAGWRGTSTRHINIIWARTLQWPRYTRHAHCPDIHGHAHCNGPDIRALFHPRDILGTGHINHLRQVEYRMESVKPTRAAHSNSLLHEYTAARPSYSKNGSGMCRAGTVYWMPRCRTQLHKTGGWVRACVRAWMCVQMKGDACAAPKALQACTHIGVGTRDTSDPRPPHPLNLAWTAMCEGEGARVMVRSSSRTQAPTLLQGDIAYLQGTVGAKEGQNNRGSRQH